MRVSMVPFLKVHMYTHIYTNKINTLFLYIIIFYYRNTYVILRKNQLSVVELVNEIRKNYLFMSYM